MKKCVLFLVLVLVAQIAAMGQTIITLGNSDITLNTTSGGSTKMGVAYHPSYGNYYCGSGGGTSSSVMVFNSSGTVLQTISCNFDDRDMWYNSNTGRIEGNGYATTGYGYYPLNGSGLITGNAVIFASGQLQPDGQSCGAYNSLNNEIVFFSGNTFYHYNLSGTLLGSLGITLPPGAGTINGGSAICIPISGQEYGIYDATNKKVYCYNRSSGAQTVTYVLPASAPAADSYDFSFSNNHIWISDNSQWFGYPLLPSQTIIFGALADKTYGDAPFTVSATGGASGNPVIFTSSDPTVATCTGTNGTTVTILKAGTVTIYANQAGNGSWGAAPQVSQGLTIDKKTLTVTGAIAADKVYDGLTTATLSGGTLSGIVGSDVVTLANATSGTFASATAGTGITVTAAMALSGAAAGNYTLTQPTLTANITVKTLTVNDATVANKIYDGTTTAAISGGTLSGIVGSDVVTLANATSGIFTSATVGISKTVTSAMTLSGAAAGNYTLTQPTLSANITVKSLTVTGAGAVDKIYDGTTTAIISGGVLSGIVGSDDVTLADNTTGTFASANVGADISVTSAMSITGADTDNYSLTQPTLSANITIRELTVSGATAAEKIYDGTTDAPISGATLEGIVGSDDVALADDTTGTFTSANVGTDISVTTAMTLTGISADNYSLTQPTITSSIFAKTITVSDATVADKVYDGTTDASISGATLDGIVGSDDVSLANETSGIFDSPNVGSGISVATAMTLTGVALDNYELTQPTLTANITTKELIVTGASADEKIYDGTTDAIISGTTLEGIVGSDDVSLADETLGTFASANVGSDISVTTVMTLTGTSADNYTLTQPTLTSNITAKELTVTGATATDKVYDGTKFATISGSTLTGVVRSDDVSLVDATVGIFASIIVGTDISVGCEMGISGAASDNYSLTQPTLTATITAKELTVTGALAADKSYDGTTDATISGATLEGIVGSDDVALANDATGTFATANSGTDISVTTEMTLTGADAGNYTLVQPTLTATIIGITLTLNDAVAANKVYDATTTAVISGSTLVGIISPDVVSLSNATTGTFASANVGTGISVTSAMTLSGADAGKYMLTQPTLTANITKKDISVTAADKTKIQGEANPAFTLTYSGFEGSDGASVIDVLPVASCVADASSAAGDYDIILTGGSDNNYNLVLHNGKLTVDPATTILTAKAGEVSIYPNPASDYIIVNNLQEKMTIRIFNLLGKLVKTTIVSGTEKISISDLSTGVYIIKISGKGIETVTRFVKQ
jgi:MBG domain (YGX type)/YDG domain/Secretion system C-terminal sorting domain